MRRKTDQFSLEAWAYVGTVLVVALALQWAAARWLGGRVDSGRAATWAAIVLLAECFRRIRRLEYENEVDRLENDA